MIYFYLWRLFCWSVIWLNFDWFGWRKNWHHVGWLVGWSVIIIVVDDHTQSNHQSGIRIDDFDDNYHHGRRRKNQSNHDQWNEIIVSRKFPRKMGNFLEKLRNFLNENEQFDPDFYHFFLSPFINCWLVTIFLLSVSDGLCMHNDNLSSHESSTATKKENNGKHFEMITFVFL